jgi:signal transduction histidine kinase
MSPPEAVDYSAEMTTADRPDRSWPSLVRDLGPVLAVIALTFVLGRFERGRDPIAAVVIAVPLLFRRRWPLGVLWLVAAIAVTTSTHSASAWVQVAAVLVASFTTGEETQDRTRSALTVLVVASLMALGFLAQEVDTGQAVILPFVVLVPSWLLGDVVRTRRDADRERDEAAARAIRDHEERLRAAVAEERRQMARELHDVVAHGVSVMLIQAGAARQVVQTAPDRAEEALLTVEATGREAMAELRRLLGVLNDDGEAAGVAPQPGVGQLEALVARVRDAGLPVELAIAGDPRTLPPSLDVTVYRIVQEALTNALRYARGAATLVRLSFDADQLRLEILDDGPVPTADAGEGSGRGLVGMQQRAAQVGGRLEAGPRLGGGYAVRAWLPVASDPAMGPSAPAGDPVGPASSGASLRSTADRP